MSKIQVKPGDWITIGLINAVVCNVYKDNPNIVEVVYLDKNKAINDDVRYSSNGWEFRYPKPSGGYADKYSRLNPYVSILRSGRTK